MSGVRFQRGNHVVANLDRALTFYQGVLGFEVTYILPPKAESYSYPVFDIPRSAQMRFCALSTDTQERVMAIVLEIQDPDAVMAGARGLGLQVYDEEILKTQDGRTGREIGIVDFDDNLVVIYKINGATST
jgi:catechol 2,3-dioxygenase-like lactoylglutathione lyase family enzyme